jgi:hypothetical protein
MTTSLAANDRSAVFPRARDVPGWLALAAAPTYALMAWIAANAAPPIVLCASHSGLMPISGMTAMYVLMSFFHVSPWLKLASRQAWASPSPVTPSTIAQGD